MCSVARTGTRVRNASLCAGQTDRWIWQRLSKPFVINVLLKVEAVLESKHERDAVYLSPHDPCVKSAEESMVQKGK